jgi:hypothetical protein
MNYNARLSDFDIDMKRGAQAELLVADICRSLGNGCGSIEVKRDSWIVHRERFYVEYECKRASGHYEPSGIAVTKAAFWAFVAGAHALLFVFSTDILKRAARKAYLDKSRRGECKYGKNPTRGVYVYLRDIIAERDTSFDEHG